MSELADKVAELAAKAGAKGIKLLEDRGEGWLDKAFDKGEEIARELDLGPDAVLDRELALDGLAMLRKHKGAIAAVGVQAATEVVAHVWHEDLDEARWAYLSAASFDERRAAMHAGTDEVLVDRVAREAAWAEFEELLEEVGKVALKAAIPVLLAAVGI